MANSLNTYKRLARLCGDILENDEHRISAYIDKMAKFLMVLLKEVHNWRIMGSRKTKALPSWIRNQIVQGTRICQGKENICHPDDVVRLNNFYSRIM